MDQSIISQDSSREKQSKTNFEMFAATDGVLRVTECYDIGRLDVKFGSCTSTLIRSKNTQSSNISIALRFEFKNTNKMERTSVLDQDEIASLDAALKYITANRDRMVQAVHTYTEVVYRSRGGWRSPLIASTS